MLHDADNPDRRTDTYRESARKLRRLAFEIEYDFCRREQLRALAGAFDRLADRVEGADLPRAAD